MIIDYAAINVMPEGGGGGLRDRVGTIPWDKICIRKLSDQNRERTQPKLFPHW